MNRTVMFTCLALAGCAWVPPPDSKKLDAKKTDDPFGQPYRVVCEDNGETRVYSNGRDGKEGTPDDIRDDFKPSDVKRVAEL